MGVYRPQYKDRKTGGMKHTKLWYYEFVFAGRLVKESSKTRSKTVAKEAEKRRRRELEEGFNGLLDDRDERVRPIKELAHAFFQDYKVRQPRSATFADYAISHILRLMGELMAVDVNDRTVIKYQTDRRKENAAPKTVNEEVGFLLRLLPITQAGALRAQLRQQKKLKLRVNKCVGKAYSPEEKEAIIKVSKAAPRSRAIHMATMLALHAGMRDKEIRTVQWNRLNLENRIITIGESKTDAGTGRTIPMNDDLFSAAVEYAKWYTGRFGASQAEWYVFPFGRPTPSDPTRPQTSLKTAWRNVRSKAKIEGRFHDTRHTFVTDLAESGAADEVIRDMAGHVSKDMLKHYSHIRTQAKRQAVSALATPANIQTGETVLAEEAANGPNLKTIPQDLPQVTAVN